MDPPPLPASAVLPATSRVEVMDALRGFAICGLPVIHIFEFGFSEPPIMVPEGWPVLDQALFYLVAIFGTAKFISLFGLLFGAGMVLASRSADERGVPIGGRFIRRFLFLLVLGLTHAYLIWHGDILAPYALLALLLFWARGWMPKTLCLVGGLLLAVIPVCCVLLGAGLMAWGGDLSEFTGESPEEEEFLQWIDEGLGGGLVQQLPVRAVMALIFQVAGFPLFVAWFSGGLILLGMAGAKTGYLLGDRSQKTYRRRAWILLPLGIALGILGKVVANQLIDQPALLVLCIPLGYLAILITAGGYLHTFLNWAQNRPDGILWRSLAAVGRMALTNYLAQSILLGLIFYGHGLGLRGDLSVGSALLCCPAIWLIQILFSRWWLSQFRFGPIEWLWRCVTYWRWISLRAPSG